MKPKVISYVFSASEIHPYIYVLIIFKFRLIFFKTYDIPQEILHYYFNLNMNVALDQGVISLGSIIRI